MQAILFEHVYPLTFVNKKFGKPQMIAYALIAQLASDNVLNELILNNLTALSRYIYTNFFLLD